VSCAERPVDRNTADSVQAPGIMSWSAGTDLGNQTSLWVRPYRVLLLILAIRFVLSDAYATMTREERQRLLHEGTSNAATLSAYVEIVFDSESSLGLVEVDEWH
jgi:hypothetical protein